MNGEKIEKILREVCFKIRVKGREALREYAITPAKFDVLQRLYFGGPQTMSILSQSLGIAKSTTTGLIKRLEKEGFVEREVKSDDKRVVFVKITQKGVDVINSVIRRRIEFVSEVMKVFSFEENSKFEELLVKFDEKVLELTDKNG